MKTPLSTSILVLVLAAPSLAQDWVIPAGQEVTYDTIAGRRTVQRLIIEPGATLRIVGSDPFVLIASDSVVVRGTLDLSGFDAGEFGSSGSGSLVWPTPGAGAAGGGAGAGLSVFDTIVQPFGPVGFGPRQSTTGGGLGGESTFATGGSDNRRAAGGGGGVLAANAPIDPDPDSALNQGRIAEAGREGGPNGLGAFSQSLPGVGGLPGPLVFTDAQPQNDFWGSKLLGPGTVTAGELVFPVAGQGGGAGGNALSASAFAPPYATNQVDLGGCGGGGGGLGFVLTRSLTIEAGGRVLANGGRGGGGQNTIFFDRIGGGGGGGSAGMLVFFAGAIDFSLADDGAIRCLGGLGGQGEDNLPDGIGRGGMGGPGVIQLHTTNGLLQDVLLPTGKTLADVTWPEAHILLPF